MYEDISKPPAPLPTPQLKTLQPGVSLLPPLLRRGDRGPGLIILCPDSDPAARLTISEGVPSLLLKWAEEGYTVVEIQLSALKGTQGASSVLKDAITALSQCDSCEPKEKAGLIAYTPELWNLAVPSLAQLPSILAAVVYADGGDRDTLAIAGQTPTLRHIAGGAPAPSMDKKDTITQYHYPDMKTHLFAMPFQDSFHYTSESMTHTRNLSFLKPRMGGPYFDLEAIWEEHTHYEFADRSVEHTMSTMVQEPYVNHVPTLTGGVGRTKLSQFYRNNFIFNNSDDTELEMISRTIGIDRVIDEFIFKFTHDKPLDWLVPGVPPTNKKVEVPFTGVVNIRGDRLYHEHIGWDQGTVLRQLGLMPEYLPFPFPLPDGRVAEPGKSFEYRVPVLGKEVPMKMRERNSVPSNEMFEYQVREV